MGILIIFLASYIVGSALGIVVAWIICKKIGGRL